MASLNTTNTFSSIDSKNVDALISKTSSTEDIISLFTLCSIHDQGHGICQPQAAQPLRSWYRTSHAKSRAKEDGDGNILCGNQEWELQSLDDIAVHFAEFHSDKENRKDTGLISITHDPIRALKAAYCEWRYTPWSSQENKAGEIVITVIQSRNYYLAADLKKLALASPLRERLSEQALKRLKNTRNAFLHDSEAVCVQRIPTEHIKHRICFESLLEKGLEINLLPELKEYHSFWKRPLCPVEIRRLVERSCDDETGDKDARLKTIYCVLAGVGAGPGSGTLRSLKLAQQLMHDDPSLNKELKEIGIDTLQGEIVALKHIKARRGVIRGERVS